MTAPSPRLERADAGPVRAPGTPAPQPPRPLARGVRCAPVPRGSSRPVPLSRDSARATPTSATVAATVQLPVAPRAAPSARRRGQALALEVRPRRQWRLPASAGCSSPPAPGPACGFRPAPRSPAALFLDDRPAGADLFGPSPSPGPNPQGSGSFTEATPPGGASTPASPPPPERPLSCRSYRLLPGSTRSRVPEASPSFWRGAPRFMARATSRAVLAGDELAARARPFTASTGPDSRRQRAVHRRREIAPQVNDLAHPLRVRENFGALVAA